jgi:archaetidylinositol phosphate synthase
MSATAPREKAFLLAVPEQRLLEAIARRLPAAVRPDHLTGLALAAAAGFAVAAATGRLRLCAALLVVHWLGDSLDGTLARVRGIGRPRYGYYLDHLVDAFATAMIGIGIGLSPYMALSIGAVLVVAYLILSINVYLESQALGRFSIGYGKLGPTEARILLIALNTALALGLDLHVSVAGLGIGVLDVVGIGLAAGMLGALVVRARGNLRALAKLEPGASRHARPTV